MKRPIESVSGWESHRGALAIAVLLALLCIAAGASAQTLTQLRDSGPRGNRINLVLLSEGYTTGELSTKFPADAQRVLNGFLETEPYREYRDYINAFSIAVASAESGSDHPSRSSFKNTYFNSSYDSYGQDRLVTIPPNNFNGNSNDGYGKVMALLSTFVPDYDLVVMIVNDDEYGRLRGSSFHRFNE